MENEINNSGKKKRIKKFGVIAGIIVIAILAGIFFTATFSKNYRMDSAYFPGLEDSLEISSPDMGEVSLRMENSLPESKSDVATDQSLGSFEEGSGAPLAGNVDRRVIKNGNLSIKVDRMAEAREKISTIARENGGEIFSSNIYNSGSKAKRGTIVVKVPVENFERTMDELKKPAALVINESTSGTDVTEEYQDLQMQIKNRQAEEQSYVRILDQAQKIEDVLAVTKQISRVRGEIEQLQGRIKYMEAQTNMSTITVSLSEDPDITVVDSWRPWQVAKDAVNSLIKYLQGFVDFLIVFVITFLPVAVLYFLVIFMIFLVVRRIYRRFKDKDGMKRRGYG